MTSRLLSRLSSGLKASPWQCSGSRSAPRLHRPQRLSVRYNSSQASGSSGRNPWLGLFPTLGLAVGAGAALTYIILDPNILPWKAQQKSQIFNSSPGLNNAYGTAEDFRKAISELRAAFPDQDTVSTDEEVLETHGFSGNDYHPGMT